MFAKLAPKLVPIFEACLVANSENLQRGLESVLHYGSTRTSCI